MPTQAMSGDRFSADLKKRFMAIPTAKDVEHWMRGPVDRVPALLQPVAHALLQARDEIRLMLTDFDDSLLWQQPAGLASVGFHLNHIRGVLDRLFTYAQERPLSPVQLEFLANEKKQDHAANSAGLLHALEMQVDLAISQLETTDVKTLTMHRGVGRKQLPSTVMGLLFHAAEHTMRHTGQLLVTIAVLRNGAEQTIQ